MWKKLAIYANQCYLHFPTSKVSKIRLWSRCTDWLFFRDSNIFFLINQIVYYSMVWMLSAFIWNFPHTYNVCFECACKFLILVYAYTCIYQLVYFWKNKNTHQFNSTSIDGMIQSTKWSVFDRMIFIMVHHGIIK